MTQIQMEKVIPAFDLERGDVFLPPDHCFIKTPCFVRSICHRLCIPDSTRNTYDRFKGKEDLRVWVPELVEEHDIWLPSTQLVVVVSGYFAEWEKELMLANRGR